jgi:hypothetical protein
MGGDAQTVLDPGGILPSSGYKDGPAPPDYMGAAQAQADASMANTTAQTWANRPNTQTPWGSQTWDAQQVIDPATGKPVTSWTSQINLSPEQQAIFDSQQQLQGGRTDLANQLLGNASNTLGTPADWSGLPSVGNGMDARNRAEDALYSRATSRLDPQWTQREDQTRTRLYNQGLREGDSAFDQAMGNLGRERTDAYDQAQWGAIGSGGQEMTRQFGQEMQGRQQSIAEILQQRGSTLNELQGLLSGQQVQMPQQPGFMGSGLAQAPNTLGATQAQYGAQLDQYNAQQAQQQGNMMGAASLLAYAFSDARMKTDIRYLDAEALPGVRWATWKWKAGGRGRGVIAQDVAKVRPDLVRCDEASGMLQVNYAGIGA